MDDLNMRKSPRARVNMLVGETIGGKYFVPLAADLSEEGVFVELPAGMEIPSDHDPVVEIPIPGVSDLVWARCRVLRDEPRGFFSGQALKFLDISAVDRQRIRYYVHRRCGLS